MRSSKRSGGVTHTMQAAPTSKCIYTPAPMGPAIALYYFIPLAIRPRAYEYVKKKN